MAKAKGPWQKLEISWKLIDPPRKNKVDNGHLRALIQRAFDVWTVHIDFRRLLVYEAMDGKKPDTCIGFYSGDHGDGEPFDGYGYCVGHAFRPGERLGGDIHMDDDDVFNFDYSLKQQFTNSETTFFPAFVHEVGHSLGLGHQDNDSTSIMYSKWTNYGKTSYMTLNTKDQTRIKELYSDKLEQRLVYDEVMARKRCNFALNLLEARDMRAAVDRDLLLSGKVESLTFADNGEVVNTYDTLRRKKNNDGVFKRVGRSLSRSLSMRKKS